MSKSCHPIAESCSARKSCSVAKSCHPATESCHSATESCHPERGSCFCAKDPSMTSRILHKILRAKARPALRMTALPCRTALQIIFLFFLFLSTAHATQDNYPFSSSSDATRFQTLTNEIRCVVCQNQSIADSNAPLANDLREKVYRMVIAQKSDEDIKKYLSQRYGDYILLQPRFNQLTLVLWCFPFIALLFVIVILKKFIYQEQISLPGE